MGNQQQKHKQYTNKTCNWQRMWCRIKRFVKSKKMMDLTLSAAPKTYPSLSHQWRVAPTVPLELARTQRPSKHEDEDSHGSAVYMWYLYVSLERAVSRTVWSWSSLSHSAASFLTETISTITQRSKNTYLYSCPKEVISLFCIFPVHHEYILLFVF